MFHHHLMTMAPLKNGMILRENAIYMRILICKFQKDGNILLKNNEIGANLIAHDHHLIKAFRVISLDKLASVEISSILILKVQNKPSSNIYFENFFNYNDIDWAGNYMLPRLVMHTT